MKVVSDKNGRVILRSSEGMILDINDIQIQYRQVPGFKKSRKFTPEHMDIIRGSLFLKAIFPEFSRENCMGCISNNHHKRSPLKALDNLEAL